MSSVPASLWLSEDDVDSLLLGATTFSRPAKERIPEPGEYWVRENMVGRMDVHQDMYGYYTADQQPILIGNPKDGIFHFRWPYGTGAVRPCPIWLSRIRIRILDQSSGRFETIVLRYEVVSSATPAMDAVWQIWEPVYKESAHAHGRNKGQGQAQQESGEGLAVVGSPEGPHRPVVHVAGSQEHGPESPLCSSISRDHSVRACESDQVYANALLAHRRGGLGDGPRNEAANRAAAELAERGIRSLFPLPNRPRKKPYRVAKVKRR